MAPWASGPTTASSRALNIRRALDASLKRLQTDYVDLYQFHHIDRDTPWDEIWQAMEVAVQQGKILYAGSSNFAGWHIAKAQGVAKARNYMGLVSEQSIYNLIERTVELEVLPGCDRLRPRRHPVVAAPRRAARRRHPQGEARASAGSRAARRRRWRSCGPQIEQYETFCDELGQEPGDVALAWLLHQPAVTAPIIGPRTARAARCRRACRRAQARRRRAQAPRRDLPRPQDRARGLRLVVTPFAFRPAPYRRAGRAHALGASSQARPAFAKSAIRSGLIG